LFFIYKQHRNSNTAVVVVFSKDLSSIFLKNKSEERRQTAGKQWRL